MKDEITQKAIGMVFDGSDFFSGRRPRPAEKKEPGQETVLDNLVTLIASACLGALVVLMLT